MLLLAISIARLWIQPLPSSFWTDELVTRFLVQHPHDPSLAAVPQLTTSPYYWLPRVFVKLFGESEIMYRLPSLLLMGLAVFVIARLSARLIHPDAAWFAVFSCLAFPDFDYNAGEARPYPLGICVACLAMYFLVRWLDTARLKHAVTFLAFAVFLWWVHLLYWVVYPIFVVYALLRLLGRDTPVTWRAAIALFAVLIIALSPTAIYAIGILPDSAKHNFAQMPRLRILPMLMGLQVAIVAFALVWLVAMLRRWPIDRGKVRQLLLPLFWWLWIPACLYIYSRFSGQVLVLPRYMSPMLPGAALTIPALVALYLPSNYWRHAAVLLGVGGLLAGGSWNHLELVHTFENWRDASFNADLNLDAPDTPVLAVSPYVEAQPPEWRPDYKLPGFLYAPIDFYPVGGKIYPLTFRLSPEATDSTAQLVTSTLASRSRFIVYGAGRNCDDWIAWLQKRPELRGWKVVHQDAGEVLVAIFMNPTASPF